MSSYKKLNSCSSKIIRATDLQHIEFESFVNHRRFASLLLISKISQETHSKKFTVKTAHRQASKGATSKQAKKGSKDFGKHKADGRVCVCEREKPYQKVP